MLYTPTIQNFKRLYPYLAALSFVFSFCFFLVGFYLGIFKSPADYQQGEFIRIMYVHVPSAWMSLGIYILIGTCSFFFLIWKNHIFDIIAKQASITGAVFTLITLITGAIWGKPIWGAWWVWDGRLTSTLILFFLYCGYIALWSSAREEFAVNIAPAILAVVGLVNIPIVKYSVRIWTTLHQGSSFANISNPSIHHSMLAPLLCMFIGCMFFFVFVLSLSVRTVIYKKKRLRLLINSCTAK